MAEVIRIGTRRSRLSRWQAEHIASLLQRAHAGKQPSLEIEIRPYSTRGDANPDAPLPAIGGKGLFTEALERALRRQEIDCAVHSLKDLPVEQAAGLDVIVPARGDARDALLSRGGMTLAQLPPGARIGTGSLRRRAQLLALRPDLVISPLRGNVPTRLRKLLAADSAFDAIVLAAAGLHRLGLDAHISEIFPPERLLCAAGQGALALQCRADERSRALFRPLRQRAAALTTAAERAMLSALAGGCSLPVAAYAQFERDTLRLQGRVTAADGSQQLDARAAVLISRADDAGEGEARQLGEQLAQRLLALGARPLLDAARNSDGR